MLNRKPHFLALEYYMAEKKYIIFVLFLKVISKAKCKP